MPTIILPKSAITELNSEYVKVQLPDEYKQKKLRDWNGLNNARGILKKYKFDPIEYQNKSREEWENRE